MSSWKRKKRRSRKRVRKSRRKSRKFSRHSYGSSTHTFDSFFTVFNRPFDDNDEAEAPQNADESLFPVISSTIHNWPCKDVIFEERYGGTDQFTLEDETLVKQLLMCLHYARKENNVLFDVVNKWILAFHRLILYSFMYPPDEATSMRPPLKHLTYLKFLVESVAPIFLSVELRAYNFLPRNHVSNILFDNMTIVQRQLCHLLLNRKSVKMRVEIYLNGTQYDHMSYNVMLEKIELPEENRTLFLIDDLKYTNFYNNPTCDHSDLSEPSLNRKKRRASSSSSVSADDIAAKFFKMSVSS